MLLQCLENAVLGRLEMVQCNFFSYTNQKHVCWKMFKVSGYSVVLRKYIFYNAECVEACKISEVFWAKRYWTMSDPFCVFLLALRLSARKLKDKLQIWSLNNLLSGPNFAFLRLFQGIFNSIILKLYSFFWKHTVTVNIKKSSSDTINNINRSINWWW